MARVHAGSRSMHGADIGPEGRADGSVALDRLEEDLLDDVGRNGGVAEARGDPVDDRGLEARLMQDGAEHEACNGRLRLNDGFGLGAQAVPDRVDLAGDGAPGSRLQARLCHGSLPAGARLSHKSIDKKLSPLTIDPAEP